MWYGVVWGFTEHVPFSDTFDSVIHRLNTLNSSYIVPGKQLCCRKTNNFVRLSDGFSIAHDATVLAGIANKSTIHNFSNSFLNYFSYLTYK